jgi:peptide/nickel transport system substrate-binding protein
MDWGINEGVTCYGDLAESWEIDESGTVYTFKLYEGVTWHDGEPVTSEDVKYTYDTIIENGYPLAAYLADVVDIRAPDDLTLVIELDAPNPAFLPFLAQISNWYGMILPKHIYEGKDWTTNPLGDTLIGSGPFKFVEYVEGSHTTLVANEDYFRGPPGVDKIVIEIVPDPGVGRTKFFAGEYPILDMKYAPTSYAEIQALMESDTIEVVFTGSHFSQDLMLNLDKPPLDDVRVRKAIAYAIDREAMNQLAFMGMLTPSYHVGTTGYPEFLNMDIKYPDHDPDMAAQLLDDAGYPLKEDGTRFTIHVTAPVLPAYELITEVLVEQLRAVGIDAVWDKFDATTWANVVRGDRDYELSTYYMRFGPDPDAYREHFGTGQPRNFTGYSNPEVDALLEEALTYTDPEKRKEIYYQVQELILEDMPYIPLIAEGKVTLVRKGWEGWPTQPSGFNTALGWFGYWAVTPPQ